MSPISEGSADCSRSTNSIPSFLPSFKDLPDRGVYVFLLGGLLLALGGPPTWADCPTICYQSGYRTGYEIPCTYTCPANTYKVANECCCSGPGTPIIIDTDGDGFHLTDAENGVLFPFFAGRPVQMAWTALGGTNAWLVLDRNKDGLINDGTELFGDLTPQPPPPKGQIRNGFLALAEYDKKMNGGNEDGVIDKRDQIYQSLRLWIDSDHDGKSSPDELHSLPSLGVGAIELKYVYAGKTDEFGNQFRLKARILREDGSHDGRWAYDVFLRFAGI